MNSTVTKDLSLMEFMFKHAERAIMEQTAAISPFTGEPIGSCATAPLSPSEISCHSSKVNKLALAAFLSNVHVHLQPESRAHKPIRISAMSVVDERHISIRSCRRASESNRSPFTHDNRSKAFKMSVREKP